MKKFDPRWKTSTVCDLARTIANELAYDRLPILGDAFMDAGCDKRQILNLCRFYDPRVLQQIDSGNVIPIREIEVDELAGNYNWREVFGEEGCYGDKSSGVDCAAPGSSISLTQPKIANVKSVIASVNGENDGDEWLGVFYLADGRFLVASGWCDYTGWG